MNLAVQFINAVGDGFIKFAWPMFIQSSLLIAILLLADLLLRKRVRAVFRYWLWMLVLIKLILPVSLATPASLGQLFGNWLNNPKSVAGLSHVFEQGDAIHQQDTLAYTGHPAISDIFLKSKMTNSSITSPLMAASTVKISLPGFLLLAWLTVVVGLLLLLAQRAIFVHRLVKRSKLANLVLQDTLEFCRRRIPLDRQVDLKLSRGATSPAVCGLFRPVILVPNDLAASLGSSNLRAVLMHELAHIKRGDLWINLAQTLLQIIYFYNPLLWLANSIIRRVREQAVDETVQVALGEKALQYPQTLINVAKLVFEKPALSLCLVGVVESKTALKERVRRMLERKVPQTSKLGIIGLLAIFVTGAVLLPMAAAQKSDSELPDEMTAKPAGLCQQRGQGKAFEINKKLGRGINLGNALEAPIEGQWGVTLQEEYFKLIKEAGFDTVRIPIRFSAHADVNQPYTIDSEFFDRVDWAVDNALFSGLNVVINVHHYEEIFQDPNGHSQRFVALWKQIAERYKDYHDNVLFELLNEPHDKLCCSKWNTILADALKVVRESNSDRVILIGPGVYNNIDNLAELQLPCDDRNIIVTCHYYRPFKFTHQGAEWVGKNADDWLGTQWTGTEQEKETVQKDFEMANQWARQNNRPINIGEFGAFSKADIDSRARYTNFVARTAEEKGFSWMYWEFCSGFGAYDKDAQAWREPLLKALIPD